MQFKNRASYIRLKSSSTSMQYFKRYQNIFEFTLVISESLITDFRRGGGGGKVKLKLCWVYAFLITF